MTENNSDHRATVLDEEMQSLLCDEEPFLSSPSPIAARNCAIGDLKLFSTPSLSPISAQSCSIGDFRSLSHALQYQEEDQERDELFLNYVTREKSYSPCISYLTQLQVSRNLFDARSKAVQYVINVCERLNLAASTALNAANYLDRFLSMNSCMKWEVWMVELVSIACLSLSCKVDEVYIPSLHDLQMEDLEHKFMAGTIQEMELTVLKALSWRLACVTPLSYVDLLLGPTTHKSNGHVTHLLLHSLSDPMILKFRASVIAISALRCAYKMITTFNHLIPLDEMADVDRCTEMLKLHVEKRKSGKEWSPVSVIGAQFYNK